MVKRKCQFSSSSTEKKMLGLRLSMKIEMSGKRFNGDPDRSQDS